MGEVDGRTCDAGMDEVVLTCLNETCSMYMPVESPDPRYVDNGDGTVTDRQTCLVRWREANTCRGATGNGRFGNLLGKLDDVQTWKSLERAGYLRWR